jgi:hypothetical protein
MLNKVRALHTNENVLLAVDTLLRSKSAFLTTFLMTYMIRISIDNSPIEYIVFRLASYAAVIILIGALMHLVKKSPLLAWRLGMLFSVVQIIVIMTCSHMTDLFPYILAVITGFEVTLYGRPFMFFSITEVRNEHRLRFNTLRQVLSEIAKIITPIATAFAITSTGYIETAIVILVISVVQLLLSVLFRPSREINLRPHTFRAVISKITHHRSLRRLMYLQFFRGALVSGSAFLVIPTLLLYNHSESDFDLGLYASIAGIISIIAVLAFHKIYKRKRIVRDFLMVVTTASILVPFSLVLTDSLAATIALYIFVIAIFEGFFNVFLVTTMHNVLKYHLGEGAYTVEVEAVSEVFLCTGRVVAFTTLLTLINFTGTTWLPLFAVANALFIIPIIFLSYIKGSRV